MNDLAIAMDIDRIPKIATAIAGADAAHSNDINDSAKTYASVAAATVAEASASAESVISVAETSNYKTSQDGWEVVQHHRDFQTESSRTFTEMEPRNEKIAMIHSAIIHAPLTSRREEGGCLKSFVGQFLKKSYPSRFPNRKAVEKFLNDAIELGLVQESSIDDQESLSIIRSSDGTILMEATAYPPVSVDLLSKTTHQLASTKWPFMLFILSGRIDKNKLPTNLIKLSYNSWIILMFKKLKYARSAVSEIPALKFGFLVDWREIHSRQELLQRATEEEAAEKEEYGELTPEESTKAKLYVCNLLEFCASNDDFLVHESLLCKLLFAKHSDECASKKQAQRWLVCAVDDGLVEQLKIGKNKFVRLPRFTRETSLVAPSDIDTQKEEDHVANLIRTSDEQWIEKSTVIQSLKENFRRMQHGFLRHCVFQNGSAHKKFFVAKSVYGQVVALTQAYANFALKFLVPPESEPSLVPPPPGFNLQSCHVNDHGTEIMTDENVNVSCRTSASNLVVPMVLHSSIMSNHVNKQTIELTKDGDGGDEIVCPAVMPSGGYTPPFLDRRVDHLYSYPLTPSDHAPPDTSSANVPRLGASSITDTPTGTKLQITDRECFACIIC